MPDDFYPRVRPLTVQSNQCTRADHPNNDPFENITTNHLQLSVSYVATPLWRLSCRRCRKAIYLLRREKLGKDVRVDEVIPKARCGHCKVKGKATYVITFVGASGDAMLGAQQRD